jgi:hypothetical protein
MDMRDFFRALRTMKRDVRDDGRVSVEPGDGFAPAVASKPPAAEPVAK